MESRDINIMDIEFNKNGEYGKRGIWGLTRKASNVNLPE